MKLTQKTAIYALPFTALSYMVISVATADMAAAFPQASLTEVLSVLSVPALTAIAGIIFVPSLMRRFTLKALALTSLSLMLLGGGVCFFAVNSLALQIIFAGVTGVGYGMVSPLYAMMINSSFKGEENNAAMGLAVAVLLCGRLLMSFVSGFLAGFGWNCVYLSFVFVAAALLWCAFFLPVYDLREQTAAGAAKKEGGARLSGSIILLCVISLCYTCVNYLNVTNASLYIESYSLGSSALTGTITALANIAAVAVAVFYGFICRLTRRFTVAASFMLIALCYIYSGLCVSAAAAAAAMAAACVSSSLFNPYMLVAADRAGAEGHSAGATCAVMVFMNIGYFISSYFTSALSAICGGGTPADAFLFTGLFAAVAAILCVLLSRRIDIDIETK